MLKINEIFYSIQGEGTRAGMPCVFVRLTTCNLRCSYCDTEYAFFEGRDRSIGEIVEEAAGYKCNFIEITGGEPLVQKESLELMNVFCEKGFVVALETGGHLDISEVDKRVNIIMDIKTPSSGMSDKNLFSNLNHLKNSDEIKFVVGNREDYEFARNTIEKNNLDSICTVLISPVFGKLKNRELAEWILADGLKARMQLQMHKYIWPPDKRGV